MEKWIYASKYIAKFGVNEDNKLYRVSKQTLLYLKSNIASKGLVNIDQVIIAVLSVIPFCIYCRYDPLTFSEK